MKKYWKTIRWLVLAVIAAYGAVLVHPVPLFLYHVQAGNIMLSSDRLMNDADREFAAQIERRIMRSPLYDAAATHRLFNCIDRGRYTLLAAFRSDPGATAYRLLGSTIVLNNGDTGTDCLNCPDAPQPLGDRVVKELTLDMIRNRTGPFTFMMLPHWIRNGYAEYMAYGAADIADLMRRFRDGRAASRTLLSDNEHDRLMIAFCLDIEHRSILQVLDDRPDLTSVQYRLIDTVDQLIAARQPRL